MPKATNLSYGKPPVLYSLFPLHPRHLTLTAEAQIPSFLQRMRDQTAGNDPDRHERALARPRRAQAPDGEDDAPTYVDEATNDVVSRDEFDALVRGSVDAADATAAVAREGGENVDGGARDGEGGDVARGDGVGAGTGPGRGKKQEISEVGGAQRKRKTVRVVGAGGDMDADVHAGEEGPTGPTPKATPKTKPAKRVKKDKAVKLSFDDDGEGSAA